MRIMVFDVPADSGGALTVLNQYYAKSQKDISNQYYFIISTPNILETDNIQVISFKWVKKNWLFRLFFDAFIAPFLVKKHEIDKVISLQNITIPRVDVFQEVLIHNAIPFSEYRFKLLEEPRLWIYQNLIGKRIISSIFKSDRIIVQTNWFKADLVKKFNIDNNRIVVEKPDVFTMPIEVTTNIPINTSTVTFFYPSSPMSFKNHDLLLKAIRLLVESQIKNFKVVFTLTGNENKRINRISQIAAFDNLPIEFIGYLSQKEVYDYYRNSILIFPSFIETYGLPLVEAKTCKSDIIVADLPYSRELLGSYDKAIFIDPKDFIELSEVMKKFILNHNDR